MGHLMNYKKIAHDQQMTSGDCSSVPFRHCKNVITITCSKNFLSTPIGRIKLTQSFSWANYVTNSLLCKEQCMGQMKNNISIGWTVHWTNWQKSILKQADAKIKHYTMKHTQQTYINTWLLYAIATRWDSWNSLHSKSCLVHNKHSKKKIKSIWNKWSCKSLDFKLCF